MKPATQIVTANGGKEIVVFTDGASLGNPGPGGYGAVIVFQDLDEVIELGGSKITTTNNEMEMTAALAALSYLAHNNLPVHIYTDSAYLINGITKWVFGWEKNGWRTAADEPVSHERIWKDLVSFVRARGASGVVSWHKVAGHSGMPGNERADVIATDFGKGQHPTLYRGRLSQYHTNVLEFAYNPEASDKKSRTKAAAYSYLSLVDGVAMRHKQWASCEQRVKGKHAKFKKAVSAEDERLILADWGIATDEVADAQ